jgi:hypothetical protein
VTTTEPATLHPISSRLAGRGYPGRLRNSSLGASCPGEVPRPEEDWAAWTEYVEAAREKLAAAEEGGPGGT